MKMKLSAFQRATVFLGAMVSLGFVTAFLASSTLALKKKPIPQWLAVVVMILAVLSGIGALGSSGCMIASSLSGRVQCQSQLRQVN